MMNATEKRKAVADAYKECIGRNLYSQDTIRRECAFTPHTDGKYYSDCSSSIRLAYKQADIGLSYIGGNTAGMYNSALGSIVDITVANGVPTNPAQLRVGDILLLAGTDSSRPLCIGHVEMVYSISGGSVTLCGHGSGLPNFKDMATYCKSRYNAKTGTTKGNKGLVCVKRYVHDDTATAPTEATEAAETPAEETVQATSVDAEEVSIVQEIQQWVNTYMGGAVTLALDGKAGPLTKKALVMCLQRYLNRTYGSGLAVDGSYGPNTKAACRAVKKGSKGNLVYICQAMLYSKGYDPKGFDGSCGPGCDAAIRQYQKDYGLAVDGSCGPNTFYSLFNK